MRLGARHPHLPAELLIGPALPPGTLLAGLRPGARLGDQQRPRLGAVRQRRPGTRRVAQPLDPGTGITPAPLDHRRLRTPHPPSDLLALQALAGAQHDPRALDHPHLRARRPHDPLQTLAILRRQLDPPHHTHPRPPSSPNTSARTSGHRTGHLPETTQMHDLLGLNGGRKVVLPSSVARMPRWRTTARSPSPSSTPPPVSTTSLLVEASSVVWVRAVPPDPRPGWRSAFAMSARESCECSPIRPRAG